MKTIKILSLMALLVFCNSLESKISLPSWFPGASRSQTATQEQIDQVKTCWICQEDFQPNEDLLVLHCNPAVPHIFHKNCLDGWINEGRKACPHCRAVIPIGFKTIKQVIKKNNPITKKNTKLLGLSAGSTIAFLSVMQAFNKAPCNLRNIALISGTFFSSTRLALAANAGIKKACLNALVIGAIAFPFIELGPNGRTSSLGSIMYKYIRL